MSDKDRTRRRVREEDSLARVLRLRTAMYDLGIAVEELRPVARALHQNTGNPTLLNWIAVQADVVSNALDQDIRTAAPAPIIGKDINVVRRQHRVRERNNVRQFVQRTKLHPIVKGK